MYFTPSTLSSRSSPASRLGISQALNDLEVDLLPSWHDPRYEQREGISYDAYEIKTRGMVWASKVRQQSEHVSLCLRHGWYREHSKTEGVKT